MKKSWNLNHGLKSFPGRFLRPSPPRRQAPVCVHVRVIAGCFTNKPPLTLAPCFLPLAAGRGSRQQPRGAVNGRPVPLLCERGEGRNQRSPPPREPSAETSDSGGAVRPLQCCFYTPHSESSAGRRHEKPSVLRSVLPKNKQTPESILHFTLKAECKSVRILYIHVVWIRRELQRFSQSEASCFCRAALWDKNAGSEFTIAQLHLTLVRSV